MTKPNSHARRAAIALQRFAEQGGDDVNELDQSEMDALHILKFRLFEIHNRRDAVVSDG